MFVKRMALSLAILTALAGPRFFSQEATAGDPDDIATLVPEDALLFAEIVRPGKLYKDRNEYLAAFCTPDGKAKALELLEKAVKAQGGDELPEKLQKDIEKGFPSIQRMAVFLSRAKRGEDPTWAVVASAANGDFFKALIEDLAVFAGEEKIHQGSKILVIRKLGKHDLGATFCIAAAGKRLVASTTVASVKMLLDRASGKGLGGDIRKNPNYASFSFQTGEDPAVRIFGEMNWDLFSGSWDNRRESSHGIDRVDAALGFRKIRGITLEATLKPGKIAATTRILVDSPCPIYDVYRQPAGPKEMLHLVPGDAQIVAHLNLKGGQELLGEIDRLTKRYKDIEKKADPVFENDEQDWKKEFEREMCVSIEDVAAAIGAEIAFAMVGDDALTGEMNAMGSILFVISLTDAGKARRVIDKAIGKIGPYETKEEGDTTFWVPQQEGPHPVIALQGKVALIGMKIETIKKALKAGTDGTGFVKQLPTGAAGASKIISIRNSAIWSLLKLELGPKLPDIEKELDLKSFSTILCTEGENEMRLSSMDGGLGATIQSSVIMVCAMGIFREVFDEEETEAKKDDAPKECPPLPADKLAEEVRKHLAGMRADEVVTRDDSEAALKSLGVQAAKLLADAVRKESDPEVKGRSLGILGAWKAYDAFPELLEPKVEGFLAGLQEAAGEDGIAHWQREEMSDFPDGMEPDWTETRIVRSVEHHDLLDAPQGIRALAGRVTSGKLNVQQVRNLSAIFACYECGAAGDLLAAAKQRVEDPEAKCFLQVALGWSSDAKAKEALYAGLKDEDVWMRRASFIGIDRTKDTAVIPKLLELLDDTDHETRWNASYTLRRLTDGHAAVNIYDPDDELKASIVAAREWWEKNKATYRIGE
jgi:hypothetical protein